MNAILNSLLGDLIAAAISAGVSELKSQGIDVPDSAQAAAATAAVNATAEHQAAIQTHVDEQVGDAGAELVSTQGVLKAATGHDSADSYARAGGFVRAADYLSHLFADD